MPAHVPGTQAEDAASSSGGEIYYEEYEEEEITTSDEEVMSSNYYGKPSCTHPALPRWNRLLQQMLRRCEIPAADMTS